MVKEFTYRGLSQKELVELPLDNDVLIKKIKDFQKNTDSTSKSNIGGYQSNKSFDDKEFNESIINAISETTGLSGGYCIENWVNINGKGDKNKRHAHPIAFLSGVYYINVPKNSGVINFYDPRGICMSGMTDGNISINGFEPHSITPSNGMFLCFPSWLEHEVEENMTDEDRISISFNIETKSNATVVS